MFVTKIFSKEKKALFLLTTGLLIWAVVSTGGFHQKKSKPAFNSRNLIRLHVVANSDTEADQNIKFRVRDAILADAGRQLAATGDIAAARQLVSCSLREITATARSEIFQAGEVYSVQAEVGDFDFPTRTYGSTTFPAGNYEAVRLVIGEGKGQNWWCVLFPPLCLVDVATKVDEKSDSVYQVMASGKKADRPQGRWKIAEVIQTFYRRLIKKQ